KTSMAGFADEDANSQQREESQPSETPAAAARPETKLASDAAKQAARAQRARDRTLKRLGGLKERLVELERSVASARRDLRQSEEERTRLETEGDRLREEREGLRARLQSGTAGEVTRLGEELEATKRRARAL